MKVPSKSQSIKKILTNFSRPEIRDPWEARTPRETTVNQKGLEEWAKEMSALGGRLFGSLGLPG
jgi:hypothetical protein